MLAHFVPRHGYPQEFRIRQRVKGKGLEISFADMAQIARCHNLVQFNEGLLGGCLNAVLVPCEELIEDDAIQWHFYSKTKPWSRRRATVSEMMQNVNSWHRELLPHRLIERRTFLGWVPEAPMIVGTNQFANENIRMSGTDTTKLVRYATSYQLTFGSGGMGFFGANGGFAFAPTAMKSAVTFRADGDIRQILEESFEENVLVYDAGQKLAYYLPRSSFVLSVARHFIKRRNFRLFDRNDEEHSDLVMAEPDFDGEQKAYKALMANLDLILSNHPRHKERDKAVSDLFRIIWQNLENIATELEEAEKDYLKAKSGAPRYIHGIEYMDLIKQPWTERESLPIHEAEINQPWAHLTSVRTAVIFCRGFEQAIVPSKPELICNDWRYLPPGRNILVIAAQTLKVFLEQREAGLNKSLEWKHAQVLIPEHRDDKKTTISHVQLLRSTRLATSPNSAAIAKLEKYPHGCFILDKKSILCTHQLNTTLANQLGIGHGQSKGRNYEPLSVAVPRAASTVISEIRNGIDNNQTPEMSYLDLSDSDASSETFTLSEPVSSPLRVNGLQDNPSNGDENQKNGTTPSFSTNGNCIGGGVRTIRRQPQHNNLRTAPFYTPSSGIKVQSEAESEEEHLNAQLSFKN